MNIIKKEWIIQIIYRSIVRILSMTADCFKLFQLYLSFVDNHPNGNVYYLRVPPAREYAPFIVERCLVEINAIPPRGK